MTKPPEGDWYAVACRRASTSPGQATTTRETGSPEFSPPVALSIGPLGAVQAADREIARQTALRARAVAEFAASRPSSADRAQGEPGAMSTNRWAARPEVLRGVSEWAAQELVVALSISSEAAEAMLARSMTLVHRLSGTLAALEAGALHPGHLWTMLDKVAPIDDPTVRAEVESSLLRWSAGRVTTPAQLGARARREVLRRDARQSARRLAKALEGRGVHVRPESTDGMAAVTAILSVPEAQALYRALGAYADALEDDPDAAPRTRGQRMADCLMDLVLRPGETETPPVQLLLTVVASLGTLVGGDEPGEIDGHLVPAEMIRQLLSALTARGPVAVPVERVAHPVAVAAAVAPVEGGTGPVPAHPVPTLVEPVAASEPAAAAITPPWQEVEQAELERWWADVEQRVQAGELDDGPDRGPDLGLNRWFLDSGPDPFPDLAPFPDPEPLSVPDDQVPDITECPAEPPWPPDGPAGTTPQEDGEWWATADRAVENAGQAMRQAGRALSHARRMAHAASLADAADEAAWQAGPGGRTTTAGDALAALRCADDTQRYLLADLLAMTGGGGLVERPRIALTDALTGALLALTDLPELRRAGTCGLAACRGNPSCCSHDLTGRTGLGPPEPTDGYRPGAALDRWLRARDRRCRFPGCRRRVPRGGELDHAQPYPLGPTSVTNLIGYCTGHHRGKHQAPGWKQALAADGTLTVTTPTGLTAATSPIPY